MKYKYWLACMAQMAENIGTGKVEKLFRFAGSARVLYDMSEKELMQIPGITEADVKSVLTYKKAWNLEETWENLKRSGLYLVTREDENYPKRLLYINKPPYGIFIRAVCHRKIRKVLLLWEQEDAVNTVVTMQNIWRNWQ